ncbi:MAG: right-handed parallel beta-helix repeat-containing protein [Halobacteria archaeon]
MANFIQLITSGGVSPTKTTGAKGERNIYSELEDGDNHSKDVDNHRLVRYVGGSLLLIIFGAFMLGGFSVGPVAAGNVGPINSISSCAEINDSNAPSDGSVKVSSEITTSSGTDCVDIKTSDVTLVGDDHTIKATGSATGAAVNVTGGQTNVTVKNLTTAGKWLSGIRFSHANESLIKDVDAVDMNRTDRGSFNTRAKGSKGILITGPSFNNTVRDSNVSGNKVFGIHVKESHNNTVKNIVANNTDNSKDFLRNTNGVRITRANNNTFRNITVIGSGDGTTPPPVIQHAGQSGVRIKNGSYNTVNKTNSSNNGFTGIATTFSDNNTLGNNTANGNLFNGVGMLNSTNNTVLHTVMENNGDSGVRMKGTSTGNELVNTTLAGGKWQFNSSSGITEAKEMKLPNGTTIPDVKSKYTKIKSNATPPAAPPGAKVENTINITKTKSRGAYSNVTLSYNESNFTSESSLGMGHFNDSSQKWSYESGSKVNTSADTVAANVTSFSVFGVCEGCGGGGGSSVNRGSSGGGSGSSPLTPEAKFSISPFNKDKHQPAVGENVTFDASPSTSTASSIEEYKWEIWGLGQLKQLKGKEAYYTFEKPYSHVKIELTVRNGDFKSDTTKKEINVFEEPLNTSEGSSNVTSNETKEEDKDEKSEVGTNESKSSEQKSEGNVSPDESTGTQGVQDGSDRSGNESAGEEETKSGAQEQNETSSESQGQPGFTVVAFLVAALVVVSAWRIREN